MGSAAAVKHSRQVSRRAENLIRRQAQDPPHREEEKLKPLFRGGEVHQAGTPALIVVRPENSPELLAAVKEAALAKDGNIFREAMPLSDRRAFEASDDLEKGEFMHPRMRQRLMAPLGRAGMAAHVENDHDYGKEVAVVARFERMTPDGIPYHEDLRFVGPLSAILRNLPDEATREAWKAAGVDLSFLDSLPTRMEIA